MRRGGDRTGSRLVRRKHLHEPAGRCHAAFMPGETDLRALLRSMEPVADDCDYVFCTAPSLPEIEALCTFRETEGVTLICRRAEAERAGLPFTFPCRRITLTVHSSLEAVGLLAVVSTALARSGISANVVSAYYHDHLFVKAEDVSRALKVLAGIEGKAQL